MVDEMENEMNLSHKNNFIYSISFSIDPQEEMMKGGIGSLLVLK